MTPCVQCGRENYNGNDLCEACAEQYYEWQEEQQREEESDLNRYEADAIMTEDQEPRHE